MAKICLNDIRAILKGVQKSEEARHLEAVLRECPEDELVRQTLVNYYGQKAKKSVAARKAYCGHVLWLVRNAPESHILQTISVLLLQVDYSWYKRVRDEWRRQLNRHPKDLRLKAGFERLLSAGTMK